jgi:thiamine kinase
VAPQFGRNHVTPDEIGPFIGSVVPGTGTLDIQPLGAGLVNETYRLIRSGRSYALRLPGAPSFDFGMDRAWQARVLEAAACAGLAPPILYSDPKRGVLLTRWINGRSWVAEEARRSASIRLLAALLRRVQELPIPEPVHDMSPSTWVDCYSAALSRQPSSPREQSLRAAAASRLAQLAGLPRVPRVLCHSDLHTMNLLLSDASLILLDWEYAHMSEPLWDLAGWSANNDFGNETQLELMQAYLGAAPTQSDCTRFKLLLWLYDYICLLWSRLYLSLRPDADERVSQRATQLDARLHLPAHYSL